MAKNALMECKKIKAVTRIAAQVTYAIYAPPGIYIYILYSTSAMGDKDANNHFKLQGSDGAFLWSTGLEGSM